MKSQTLDCEPKAIHEVRKQAKFADYVSWGRYPRVAHRAVRKVYWLDQIQPVLVDGAADSWLAFGMGRSYGDSCLNGDHGLIDCSACCRILHFDRGNGVIRVEGGLSLAELLSITLPAGWFLPVTPGTKFVTVGGAVANDVHGKNHHVAGTFGCHVRELLLYRADCGPVSCSRTVNADMFAATIGGLGLTGVIGWVELQLKRVAGSSITVESIPFEGVDEFLSIRAESDRSFEYTVAWIDCFSRETRGIFFRGNHADKAVVRKRQHISPSVPFAAPDWFLSVATIRAFNTAYYGLKKLGSRRALIECDPFFYPLDAINRWNLLYGKRGLLQYQSVIPVDRVDSLRQMLDAIRRSGTGSFLAVLKQFGSIQSPGFLSFPRPGLTLALDFPLRGEATFRLLKELDCIVRDTGGALYPAKDARMSPEMFELSFPNWRDFVPLMDGKCSSSFWRRVTGATS